MIGPDQDQSLEVERLDEIFLVLAELARKSVSGMYIYRGEPNCHPRVSSSLYRQFPDIGGQHFHIESVQAEMLQAAAQFIGQFDKDDVLAQLQHYGYPTNLIDFTSDYHIALFFACDGEPQEDGRVILLQAAGYPLLKPTSPVNRVIAQKSILVRPPAGFVEPTDTVSIPRDLKGLILKYLSICHGIDVATIYNDLHGFMRHHKAHESAYAEFYAGLTHFLDGERDQAIERYNKAIGLNPQMVMAYNNRGAAWMAGGDHLRAISDFSRAIELNPQDAGAHNNRGSAYKNIGRYDLAILDYDRAIELNPGDPGIYGNRGNAYSALGKYDRALQDHNREIELNPESATSYSNRGTTYKDKGEYDRAIRDYDRAIELNPNIAAVFDNRGTAYSARGDHDLAIQDHERAIDLAPGFPLAYNNRGAAYWRKGEYQRAVENFDRAIDLNPRYAVAFYNRTECWLCLEDWEKAESDLSSAQNLGLDVADTFHREFGSIEAFEQNYGVKLPPNIVRVLTPHQ